MLRQMQLFQSHTPPPKPFVGGRRMMGSIIDTPHGPAVIIFMAFDEDTGQVEMLLELI